MKIGIIIGSIRNGRKGEVVARWIADKAVQQHPEVEFELIDLKSFDVPMLTAETLPMAAGRQYDSENLRRWGAAIDACQGFVLVTPEYNHGVPGALKNAVDSLGPEWVGKIIAFVSYGADNGVRAVEQWRQIIANFQMTDVRGQVALGLFSDFGPDGFAPLERRDGEVSAMLDQLVAKTALHERQGD